MRKTRAPGSRRAPGLVSALRAACAHAPVEVTRPAAPRPRARAPTRLIRPRRRRWPALAAGPPPAPPSLPASGGPPVREPGRPVTYRSHLEVAAHDHPEHHCRLAPDQDGPGDDHARGRPAAHPGKRERPEHSRLQAHAPGRLHRRTAASPPSGHRAHGPWQPGDRVRELQPRTDTRPPRAVRRGTPVSATSRTARDVSPRSPRRACRRGTVREHPTGAFTFLRRLWVWIGAPARRRGRRQPARLRKLTAHEHSREPQWESAALTPVRGRNTRFPISVVALTVLYA